ALRRYFAWCTRTGVIAADPSITLRAPSGPKRLPRVLHDDDLQELLEPTRSSVVPTDPSAEEPEAAARRLQDDAVLELLYGSGLRVAELCGLRPGDLDLTSGRVTVWGKGSKQRQLPMSEPAVHAVRRWLADGRPLVAT